VTLDSGGGLVCVCIKKALSKAGRSHCAHSAVRAEILDVLLVCAATLVSELDVSACVKELTSQTSFLCMRRARFRVGCTCVCKGKH